MLTLQHYFVDKKALKRQGVSNFNIIENGANIYKLLESIKDLRTFFAEYIHIYSHCTRVKNFFRQLPVGTIDYARSNLEVRYSGKQFWVTSFDGAKLDCMIIPGTGTSDISTHRQVNQD